MRSFTIYGLDRDGAVAFTETAKLVDPEEARKIAAELLLRFAKVEVWEGAVCILRSDRRKV
jgi:hypothetical protein